MMTGSDEQTIPPMDAASLYREDVYTDGRIGTIRVLTPVTSDGSADNARDVLYSGQAQLMTAMGALPLNFEIPASSLGEAIEKFAEGAKEAMEHTVKELQEMRREAASSIVLPDSPGGGLPGAGIPGGGKIRMP
jgi:hypothetical protein